MVWSHCCLWVGGKGNYVSFPTLPEEGGTTPSWKRLDQKFSRHDWIQNTIANVRIKKCLCALKKHCFSLHTLLGNIAIVVNARRMRTRVTVITLSVCVCVCLLPRSSALGLLTSLHPYSPCKLWTLTLICLACEQIMSKCCGSGMCCMLYTALIVRIF